MRSPALAALALSLALLLGVGHKSEAFANPTSTTSRYNTSTARDYFERMGCKRGLEGERL
jgi:hypothetical protein